MRTSVLLAVAAVALTVACAPGEAPRDTVAAKNPIPRPEVTREAPAPPESGRESAAAEPDATPAPTPEEAPRLGPEDGQAPASLGPGVTPPRRLEGPSFGERLNELRASGEYSWGVCIFRLTISSSGEVESIHFLKPPDLDPEVRTVIEDAVERWRFDPATKAGEPLAVEYHVSVHHCPLHRQPPRKGEPLPEPRGGDAPVCSSPQRPVRPEAAC